MSTIDSTASVIVLVDPKHATNSAGEYIINLVEIQAIKDRHDLITRVSSEVVRALSLPEGQRSAIDAILEPEACRAGVLLSWVKSNTEQFQKAYDPEDDTALRDAIGDANLLWAGDFASAGKQGTDAFELAMRKLDLGDKLPAGSDEYTVDHIADAISCLALGYLVSRGVSVEVVREALGKADNYFGHDLRMVAGR